MHVVSITTTFNLHFFRNTKKIIYDNDEKYCIKSISYFQWGKQAFLHREARQIAIIIHPSKWYLNILTWNFSSGVLLAS